MLATQEKPQTMRNFEVGKYEVCNGQCNVASHLEFALASMGTDNDIVILQTPFNPTILSKDQFEVDKAS